MKKSAPTSKIEIIQDSLLTPEEASHPLTATKVRINKYVNRSSLQSVVHNHPYYEIIAPLSGSSVRYSANGRLYNLQVGEVMIVPAGLYHSAKFNVSMDYSERLIVQIEKDFWLDALKACGLGNPKWNQEMLILNAQAVLAWDLTGLFRRMIHAATLPESIQERVWTCQLVELALFFEQSVNQKDIIAPSGTSLLVAKAADYLQNHYEDPHLNATTLAEYCFVSREHLARSFKSYTMESVHSYLTNLRMLAFKRAMLEGKSILDASIASGFSDYTSFLKTFKKLYGTTPSEYRAKLLLQEHEDEEYPL